MLSHQQIMVLSFKGPTRLSENTSANDHACSIEVMSTHISSLILEIEVTHILLGSSYAADAHTWRPSLKYAN